MKKIAFAFLIGVAASALGAEWFRTVNKQVGFATNAYITKYHDDEFNVTCWVTEGWQDTSPGISCLPDAQLKRK